MKPERKRLVKKLDKTTALVVKTIADYRCQRCDNKPHPQGCHWAHIFGRQDHRLRWNLLNALCLCYGCHSWGHSNPTAFQEWFAEKWPARMAYLNEIKKNRPLRPLRTAELENLLTLRRDKLAELKAESK